MAEHPTEAGNTRWLGLPSEDGRYRLVEFLGRGGMGEVWRAEDTALERSVALKFPRGGGSVSDAERWLVAEAHTVARLNHPNLVALLDRTRLCLDSVTDPVPALVFDFVPGKPLSNWTGRPRPWLWVRKIADQALEALAYAHGQGVIHMDLKPSNILLSEDSAEPRVHILDFGIATWTTGARALDETPAAVSMTTPMVGLVPGTRHYMAPEQALGPRGDLGPWTDLYSLGVVIAELLLGVLPFPGTHSDEIWKERIASQFAVPLQPLTVLGVPLRRFLLRLLAPDTAHRFGWAADVRRSLPVDFAADLTTGPRALSAEGTDLMMESVKGAEDRDTDPTSIEPMSDIIECESTLDLKPGTSREIVLPPSWAVDRPPDEAWEEGRAKIADVEPSGPAVPTVSYALLSMRDAPLQGREEEWAKAWEHIAKASWARRPVFVVIEGPPGRGKTRFASELAAVAEEVGVARSHHVRFRADGSGAGGLRRLLHRILRLHTLPSDLREGRVRRVLAEAGYPPDADLVPRLLSVLEPGRGRRPRQREEAATAVELLRVLARRRPLLLWLEDMDRGRDEALLVFFQTLFAAEDDLPIAVVATARDELAHDETVSSPGWMMIHAQPETLVLPMGPLADPAVAAVLGHTAGTQPELGLEIARWAKGDPRAAQQIARSLDETQRLRWGPDGYVLRGDTPSTAGALKLDAILQSRANDAIQDSRDSEATRGTLELLSLVKERARQEDLVAAASWIGLAAHRVEAALSTLVMSALVEVRDEGPRLVHLVLANSIREGIDLKRRVELHRAWAEVLESGRMGPGRAERLLEAADSRAACGDYDRSVRNDLEAAHLLRNRWELRSAWKAVHRGLERLSMAGTLLRSEEETDLQVLAAVLDHEVQEPPASASSLAASLDMLHPLWLASPASVERTRAFLLHAEALRRAGRPREALDSLQHALETARVIQSLPWQCRALTELAELYYLAGDLDEAETRSTAAGQLAHQLKDEALVMAALIASLPLAVASDDLPRARKELERLRTLLRQRASWQDLQRLWYFRAEVERVDGRLDHAQRAYDTALILGRKREVSNVPVLLSIAAMALGSDDLEHAARRLDEAKTGMATPTGPHENRVARAVLSAELAIRSGEEARAASFLQDAEILQRQSPLAVAPLLASLDRSSRALSDVQLRSQVDGLRADMRRRMTTTGRRRG